MIYDMNFGLIKEIYGKIETITLAVSEKFW